MLIDTHAHLTQIENIDKCIVDAKNAGVNKIISIGCNLEEIEKSIKLAEKYDNVYATAGLYPHDLESEAEISMDEKFKRLESFARHPKIVAIGECGLDYTTPHSPEIKRKRNEQIELFTKQIEIARKLDLPVVIHSREATEDLVGIIKREMARAPFRAVCHCFAEGKAVAKTLLDLNVMLSFTGIITYKNAESVRDSVAFTPIENIMVETDSPYLIPHHARSQGVKINAPEYVKLVAQKIAEIKEISLAEIEEFTSNNALNFFKLYDRSEKQI